MGAKGSVVMGDVAALSICFLLPGLSASTQTVLSYNLLLHNKTAPSKTATHVLADQHLPGQAYRCGWFSTTCLDRHTYTLLLSHESVETMAKDGPWPRAHT